MRKTTVDIVGVGVKTVMTDTTSMALPTPPPRYIILGQAVSGTSLRTGSMTTANGRTGRLQYPAQLENSLLRAGFQPFDNSTGLIPLCGWHRELKVHDNGVYRGWLDVLNFENGNITV